MPVDRKALRQRMKDAAGHEERKCKTILYPMPDLRGPGGNAYALLGQASSLMKQADLSETTYDRFNAEATSGDYDTLLRTIQKWFTVVVQSTDYIPLGEGVDILALKPGEDGELSWEDFDTEEASPELQEALEDYTAKAEEDRRLADLQQKINDQVRKEMGLAEDEVVIVQIKKTGKRP